MKKSILNLGNTLTLPQYVCSYECEQNRPSVLVHRHAEPGTPADGLWRRHRQRGSIRQLSCVSLSSTVKLESNNYLLVYLKLDKDVKPGKFNLTFTEGKKKLVKEYELKARNKKGCEHKGFDASDALYLLMPDRFANGNPDNDQIASMAEYKVDRNDPNARHGGDLAGIEQHLDYFSDLGVTALVYSGTGKQHDRRFLSRLCHHRLLQGGPALRYQRRIQATD